MKFLRILKGFLFILFHTMALLTMWAYCAAREIFHHQFSFGDDLMGILVALCYLFIHYRLMDQQKNDVRLYQYIEKVCKVLEYLMSALVVFVLLFPLYVGGSYLLYDTLYIASIPVFVLIIRRFAHKV